jgi:predicted RNase H-like HicB family nuclease
MLDRPSRAARISPLLGEWRELARVSRHAGCYALMATREEALAELGHVFDMIVEEYQERGAMLPEDTTEIVNA